MKIQFFFFINSILIYSTRNINLYKKSVSSRKLQESNTSLVTDTVTSDLGSTYKEVGSDTVEIKESTNYEYLSTNYEDQSTKYENQSTNYSQSLLLGFDRYKYIDSRNSIEFYTYLSINGTGKKRNISFPVTITSNRRFRNLEEKIINITGYNEDGNNDDKKVYIFKCSGSYNETPISVKYLNNNELYIDGIKPINSEATPYARQLSYNIQKQKNEKSLYLNNEPIYFYNAKIINQSNNIKVEGEYYHNYSKKGYLIFDKEDYNIPCTMDKIIGTTNSYSLICKPNSSFKGNLIDYTVNLTDINQLMFFKFNNPNSYVSIELKKEKDSSKTISAGIIVLIIFACIAVLAILGLMFYCMRKKSLHPSPSQSRDKNNNTLGVNAYNSSSNIAN